jgi:hypothetical protein
MQRRFGIAPPAQEAAPYRIGLWTFESGSKPPLSLLRVQARTRAGTSNSRIGELGDKPMMMRNDVG